MQNQREFDSYQDDPPAIAHEESGTKVKVRESLWKNLYFWSAVFFTASIIALIKLITTSSNQTYFPNGYIGFNSDADIIYDNNNIVKKVLEFFGDHLFPTVLNKKLMSLTDIKWRKKWSRKNYPMEDYNIAFKTTLHVSKNHPANHQPGPAGGRDWFSPTDRALRGNASDIRGAGPPIRHTLRAKLRLAASGSSDPEPGSDGSGPAIRVWFAEKRIPERVRRVDEGFDG